MARYTLSVLYCGADRIVSASAPAKNRKRGIRDLTKWSGSLHCIEVQLFDNQCNMVDTVWNVYREGTLTQRENVEIMKGKYNVKGK